jgi:hypothetical protein
MSSTKAAAANKSHNDDMAHENVDDRIFCSLNRKRSVQYRNEYEANNHIPKRNRTEKAVEDN